MSEVPVTQADTTAAREWLEQVVRDGLIKRQQVADVPLIALLSRHAQSARLAAIEECARVAEKSEEQWANAQAAFEFNGHRLSMADDMRQAYRDTATAIRALKEPNNG